MNKTYYSDYVKHIVKLFVKASMKFESPVDIKNYCAVQRVMLKLTDQEQKIIVKVFKQEDTLSDNIYSVCKELKLDLDGTWEEVLKFIDDVAKERELI